MNQSGAVEIFVFKEGRFLGSRCFSQTTVTIGRGRAAALKLVDPTVSEQHAVVRLEADGVVLVDDGSQSGVFVNGERISQRQISSFDEIAIGPFRLKVSMLGQEDQEDQGFGAEPQQDGPDESEAATVVRRVEQLPEYQLHLDPSRPDHHPMEEATLPRIVRPSRSRLDPMGGVGPRGPSPGPAGRSGMEQPGSFDQQETRARPPGRYAPDPASLGSFGEPAYEEMPTKAETPGGLKPAQPQPQSSFEDFSRPEPAVPAELPARRAAPAPTRPEPAVHERATRRAPALEDHAFPEEGAFPEEEAFPEEYAAEEPAWQAPIRDAADADEDADEDEIESFVEPFSLLENIVREKFKSKVETEPYSTVEVIHYQGSQILDLLRADPKKGVRVGVDNFRLLTVDAVGRASLFFKSDFKGTLVTKGKARPLKTFMTERFQLKGRRSDLYAVSLGEGDYAQVIRGSSGYLIRFVHPPKVPKTDRTVAINWGNLQIFIGSAAFHFLVLVLLGFVAPEANLTVVTDAERFAKVAVKDLKLEKPKEEPKPEAPKEEKPPPVKDTPKVVKKIKRPGPARPITERQRQKIQKKQVANVLSALENIRPQNAGPGRSNLKSLVSNIAAVRAPGGTSSSFKVAGVISKIPGGGVRLAGGLGGGGKDTRVGSQLLSGAGAKIGKIAALSGTGTRVRGRVRKAPGRIGTTGGSLDRGAIQKVVNAHMAQIQRCYEVQLLRTPGLSGKIVFDWTIAPSGSVSSARQVSSSMRNPAVATCILSLIRTWRFPQPVGGAVVVRYPFVFRIQGF